MKTECNAVQLTFRGLGRRRDVAEFDTGLAATETGALLLREVASSTSMKERIAVCFTDGRDPSQVEQPVASLDAQRVYGLALGYEDLNDHEQLRKDPLMALPAVPPETT